MNAIETLSNEKILTDIIEIKTHCPCGQPKDKRALLCRKCRDKERGIPLCVQCKQRPKVKGRYKLCKECRRQKFGESDLRKKMNGDLKKKYDIDLEQLEQMFISQAGKCAICLDDFKTTKNMCVDHNHTTGQIRQLLCQKCNSAIGFFKENPLILARAIDYLNRWHV